jgi:hypothetical protein
MKAHELAKLLLESPDVEVFVPKYGLSHDFESMDKIEIYKPLKENLVSKEYETVVILSGQHYIKSK